MYQPQCGGIDLFTHETVHRLLADVLDRVANNQFGIQADIMNRNALVVNQTKHLRDRSSSLFTWILTHRCQPGSCVSGKNVIIESHHGDILRHPDSSVIEVVDSKRRIIIRGKEECCKLTDSLTYDIIGLNDPRSTKTDLKELVFRNRNVMLLQCLTVSLPALIIDTHAIVCKKGNLFVSHSD